MENEDVWLRLQCRDFTHVVPHHISINPIVHLVSVFQQAFTSISLDVSLTGGITVWLKDAHEYYRLLAAVRLEPLNGHAKHTESSQRLKSLACAEIKRKNHMPAVPLILVTFITRVCRSCFPALSSLLSNLFHERKNTLVPINAFPNHSLIMTSWTMVRDSDACVRGAPDAPDARDVHDIPALALAPQLHHEQHASYYQKTS
jgi:hypothetical protein